MLASRIVVAIVLCVGLARSSAEAQEMDMEAMKRWTSADSIRYHIVGVYQARTNVVSGNEIGYADVTDRVVIDLRWKLAGSKLVGAPTVVNTKSVVANLRNYDAKCMPPVLKGEYEHYDVLAIDVTPFGGLALNVQTTYPAAEVVQFCSGRHKAVPGTRDTRTEELTMVTPLMLSMPLPDSGEVSVSPDKKSLVVKKDDGWTWTYTPSLDPGK
jgi:hypothetical protein